LFLSRLDVLVDFVVLINDLSLVLFPLSYFFLVLGDEHVDALNDFVVVAQFLKLHVFQAHFVHDFALSFCFLFLAHLIHATEFDLEIFDLLFELCVLFPHFFQLLLSLRRMWHYWFLSCEEVKSQLLVLDSF